MAKVESVCAVFIINKYFQKIDKQQTHTNKKGYISSSPQMVSNVQADKYSKMSKTSLVAANPLNRVTITFDFSTKMGTKVCRIFGPKHGLSIFRWIRQVTAKNRTCIATEIKKKKPSIVWQNCHHLSIARRFPTQIFCKCTFCRGTPVSSTLAGCLSVD